MQVVREVWRLVTNVSDKTLKNGTSRYGSFALYFALLAIPLCVLPYAAHRLLTDEIHRGKTVGQSFLRERAAHIASDIAAGRFPGDAASFASEGIVVGFMDGQGRPVGKPIPEDGRCVGEAEIAGTGAMRRVRVAWAGEKNPGAMRTRRLLACETAVYLGCGTFALLGVVLIARDACRARRDARSRLDYVADVSHRLKTPLTSVSLCAELVASGRVEGDKARECAESAAAEAAKLGLIVDEVLAYAREMRRG